MDLSEHSQGIAATAAITTTNKGEDTAWNGAHDPGNGSHRAWVHLHTDRRDKLEPRSTTERIALCMQTLWEAVVFSEVYRGGV